MTTPIQASFTGGELKPSIHGRVDIAKYGVSAKVLRNYIIHAGGGISNRGGQRYIVKAKYDDRETRLIKFQFSTIQTYMLEFGDEYIRVLKDGGYVLNAAKTITGITKAADAVITAVAHGYTVGKWVFINSVNGMTQPNGRFFIVSAVPTVDTFRVTDLFGNVLDSSAFDTYVSGGLVSDVYELASPYDHLDVPKLVVSQSADVMTITHKSYPVYELSRTAHNAWAFTAVTYNPNILPPPTAPTLAGPASAGGTATISYVITSVDADTGEESVASAVGTTLVGKDAWTASDYITLAWTAVAGVSKYNVYKNKNGFFGFIGPASSNAFKDDNIEPVVDDSPPQTRNPFSGVGKYPQASTLHEQRRIFAQTAEQPDTVFTSQTANYRNMNVSVPAKDSDALTFTLASEEVNAIKHLLSIGDLLAFTDNAEWKIAGAGDAALAPSTIGAIRQSNRGIADVPPLLIGDTALMVQARGKKIRDIRYSLERDGYDGNDLSILSSHLFKKTRAVDKRVKDWCYQKEPDSLVWIVHNDGSFTSLTYQREHEVWGFSRHDTDGKVQAVNSIPAGDYDAVYMIVDRFINGTWRRMIEIMENRDCDEDDIPYSFFVDGGVQFIGNPSYDYYGLEHLEGKEVWIFADGSQKANKTVTNGKITLDEVYNVVAIGLPYFSDVQPLEINTTLKDGSNTKAQKQRISEVFVQVYNTRGIWAGPNFEKLKEYTQERTNEAMNEPTRLKTGICRIPIMAEWSYGTAVCLRHQSPTPITILSILPNVEF